MSKEHRTREQMGQAFHFFSASCAEQFDADLYQYAISGGVLLVAVNALRLKNTKLEGIKAKAQ